MVLKILGASWAGKRIQVGLLGRGSKHPCAELAKFVRCAREDVVDEIDRLLGFLVAEVAGSRPAREGNRRIYYVANAYSVSFWEINSCSAAMSSSTFVLS